MRVEADNGRVVMVPVVARRKPSLADLLAECDFKKRRTRDEQSEIDTWETIKPVGREVI